MPEITKRTVSQVVRVSARTGTQVLGPGAIIALLASFDLISWNETQTAAVLALAVPTWAFVQNLLEKWSGKWFIRRS